MRKQSRPALSREAVRLHRESYVVDLHVDTLYIQRVYGFDPARRHRPRVPYSPFFNHADLPRMIQGSIDGVGLGIVLFPFFTSLAHRVRVVSRTVSDLLNLADRTRQVRLVRTVKDFFRAREAGQVAAFLGIEGAHALRGKLDLLERYHRWGVRYLTLTHFSANEAGDTCQGMGRQEGVRPDAFRDRSDRGHERSGDGGRSRPSPSRRIYGGGSKEPGACDRLSHRRDRGP